MRSINVEKITATVKDMCIRANLFLADDVKGALYNGFDHETSALGKKILGQLKENLDIAGAEQIPICQDTGMAVFFVKLGQEVHIEGGSFNDAINEGVRQGYTEGYLRKSVVADPLVRVNTKDNTPAIIHVEIVPGENIEITVAPKGFGSENMSRVFMLKPADGVEGVKNAVITAVKDAGPNACPPVVVGVGIGGDFEKAAELAKKALTKHFGAGSYLGNEVNSADCTACTEDAATKTGAEDENGGIRTSAAAENNGINTGAAAENTGIKTSAAAENNGINTGAADVKSGMTAAELIAAGRTDYVPVLERELYEEINRLNIGAGGMGGSTTCLGVNVETYPTHIAGLPVAVNMCCHVNRHVTEII